MEQKNTGLFRFAIRFYRRWNEFRAWFSNTLDADNERKKNLYIDLSRSATLKDLVYWLQILFSAGIATLGLVQNSSAVIIGAMLISPLMAPILSSGLALATGDLSLGVRAAANLFLSTLLGMAFAFILVEFLPYKDQTTEILARTQPNTLDLVIALFSGAIGAVATCRETKGVVTSIPGVAIAVALMPPLCVVGYGFALGGDAGWKIARGGGLLYLTNLVAITFMAMVVFVLLRIDGKKVRESVRIWRESDPESQWWQNLLNRIPRLEKARQVRSLTLRLLMILIPLVIIYLPLSQSFAELRTQYQQQQKLNSIRSTVEQFWEEAVENRPFSDLDEIRISETTEKLEIYIRAFSKAEFTQADRELFVNRIAGYLQIKPSTIALQIDIIPTAGKTTGIAVAEVTPTPLSLAQMKANFLQRYKDALSEFKLPPPAEMIDYSVITRSNGNSSLTFYYLSERDIDQDGAVALQNSARTLLNLPTLTLSLSRVTSTVVQLPFLSNNTAVDTSSDGVNDLVATLREHRNLSVRVVLATNGGNGTLFEQKKNVVSEFLFIQMALPREQVVFLQADEAGQGDTFQLFLRK